MKFFPLFVQFLGDLTFMSSQNGSVPEESEVTQNDALAEALFEVGNFLAATSGSIGGICTDIEAAADRDMLRKGFRALNECMRLLKEVIPDGTDDQTLLLALRSLPFSARFLDSINSCSNLEEVISVYKTNP